MKKTRHYTAPWLQNEMLQNCTTTTVSILFLFFVKNVPRADNNLLRLGAHRPFPPMTPDSPHTRFKIFSRIQGSALVVCGGCEHLGSLETRFPNSPASGGACSKALLHHTRLLGKWCLGGAGAG